MPIDPSIPLQSQLYDFSAPFRQRRENQRQNELLKLTQQQEARAQAQESREASQAATAQYYERELNRLQSVVPAAQTLLRLPDDPQAVAGFLAKRKRDLIEARASGANVDTRETDEAMAAFRRGGVAGVKQLAQQLLSDAQDAGLMGVATSQAKPSALVEQYQVYLAQGGTLPFVDPQNQGNDFITQFSRSQVGAPYGAPTDVPGQGVVVPSRTTGATTVLSPEADVSQAEAGRAAERETAVAQAQAGASLPDTLSDISTFRGQVEGLLSDPGFNIIYGMSRNIDPRMIPGQKGADAETRRNQLEAASFGIAIQKMRGLGQLSDAEGRKVSDAFTRATNPRQSETAARRAWNEVLEYLDLAEQRALGKAGLVEPNGDMVPQSSATSSADPLGIR